MGCIELQVVANQCTADCITAALHEMNWDILSLGVISQESAAAVPILDMSNDKFGMKASKVFQGCAG